MRRIRENFPVIQAVTKMASSIDLSNERKAIDHLKEIGKGYVEALNSEGYDFVFYDKTLKASEKRLIFTMETNRDPLHVELTHNWKTGEVKWVVFRGWKTFGKGKADVKKVVDEVHKVLEKNKDKIMAEDYSLNELTFDQFFQKYPFSAPASGAVGGIDKKNPLYSTNGLLKAFNAKDKGLASTEKGWFQKLIKAKLNFQDFAQTFDDAQMDTNIFMAEYIDQNMLKKFLALVDYTPAKLKKEVKAWFDDKEEFEDMWEEGYIIPDYMEEKPKLRKLLYFTYHLFAFLVDNNYVNREEFINYDDDDWDDDDTFDSYWFSRWNKMFKLKPEPNTKYEDDFLEKIRRWFDESDAQTANYLKKLFPILKQARQKYPAIFKPNVPENSPVYRGVKNLPSSAWAYMKKTEESDWSGTVMLSGRKWRILKQQIEYTPHNEAQSWSVSSNVAEGFAGNLDSGVILISQIDESFILNPSSSEALGNYEYSEEEEVIHIGKKFKSMRIAILESKWNELRGTKSKSSSSFDDVASYAVGYKSAKKAVKKTTKKATKKVAKVAAPKPKKK